MPDRVLTVKQPWADLIMAGMKDVENRSWPVPSTLPQWGECPGHGRVVLDYPPDGHIADDGPDTDLGHAPDCGGECRHCPVPVQIDPRYPCGPIEPDGPFPFRLWIHAGGQTDYDAPSSAWRQLYETEPIRDNVDAIVADLGLLGYEADALEVLRSKVSRGVLLGSVTVTGCHHADECATRRLGPPKTDCRNDHGDVRTRIPHDHVQTWVRSYCSRWAQPGQHHWTLADPVPLEEPIPMRGRQRLWTLPADVEVPA